MLSEWFTSGFGLLPWLSGKAEKWRASHTGLHHVNHLNERQRDVLVRLCQEYEQTGRPVLASRVFNEHYWPTVQEHGYPDAPTHGEEITAMLSDLQARGLVERAGGAVTPTKDLLNHLRRTGAL